MGHGNRLTVNARCRLTVLQWGRGLWATETLGTTTLSDCTSLLQWGRGLSATETSTFTSCNGTRHSFNGAAAFRPRKQVGFVTRRLTY